MHRRSLAVGVALAVVAVGVCGGGVVWLSRDPVVAEFAHPGRQGARELVVSIDGFCEVHCGYAYAVYEQGVPRTIHRHLFFYAVAGETESVEFETVWASDDLVALVERSDPQLILALHDFEQNQSWPAATSRAQWSEHRDQAYARRDALLERFARLRPGDYRTP